MKTILWSGPNSENRNIIEQLMRNTGALRGGRRKLWITKIGLQLLKFNRLTHELANLYKHFTLLILITTTMLYATNYMNVCTTSFASHSASAYLLDEIDEVSCSFRPCLREDVPLEVPCDILVQNIWNSLQQGLSIPQVA